jgi:hypothetical protein
LEVVVAFKVVPQAEGDTLGHELAKMGNKRNPFATGFSVRQVARKETTAIFIIQKMLKNTKEDQVVKEVNSNLEDSKVASSNSHNNHGNRVQVNSSHRAKEDRATNSLWVKCLT